MGAPLLEVENLQVHFDTEDGLVKAVDGISYTVDRGQTLGIDGVGDPVDGLHQAVLGLEVHLEVLDLEERCSHLSTSLEDR